MTGRKRLASATSDSGNSATKKAKRQLAVSTLEKWQRNYDKNHCSLTYVEVRRGHGLCSGFVVLGLPRVQKQNLLDEKLLTGMDNWFWESSS